jgi:molybdate transport system regulatory protein
MTLPDPPPSSPPLRLEAALGQASADRRIDILRRIGSGSSISEAARGAGVSYKAAWQALETLGNLAGQPVVDKVVGGAGGGGAHLTAAGRQLLALAERLESARRAVLAGDEVPGGLSLRTSMRNLLRCTVADIQPPLEHAGSASAHVRLRTAGGETLYASITRESVELLGLQPGTPVLALFKATAVRIETTPDAAAAATPASAPAHPVRNESATAQGAASLSNSLSGRVADDTTTPGGELSLVLTGGERLTGFALPEHRVLAGVGACARFAASAVVIALP